MANGDCGKQIFDFGFRHKDWRTGPDGERKVMNGQGWSGVVKHSQKWQTVGGAGVRRRQQGVRSKQEAVSSKQEGKERS